MLRMSSAKNELTMTVLMTPDMANFSGNVHGGHILKLLDQVAYACASRFAGMYVVTLSVDRVLFRKPIRVGELVSFLASVNYVGSTSMEVGIKVVSEDITRGIAKHTNSCFFTMVAVDCEGSPSRLPAWSPESPDQIRRWTSALRRRQERLKI